MYQHSDARWGSSVRSRCKPVHHTKSREEEGEEGRRTRPLRPHRLHPNLTAHHEPLVQESVRGWEDVPSNLNMIHGTNPAGKKSTAAIKVHEQRTSHARHCIIVSLSVSASYVLEHLQKRPRKFCPYVFVLTQSILRCSVQGCDIPPVGQSHWNRRLGKSSICS